MAAKNENLPVNVDIDLQNGGTIKYANEVIAIIAGVAAGEVDGIAGMCTSGGISDIISRNRNVTRGVRVELGGEECSVDLYTIVEYGQPIQKVALEVQENVRKAIETMTGLHVVRVDVHVQGVSFEKENQERDAAIEASNPPTALEEGKPARRKSAHKASEKPAKAAKKPAAEDQPSEDAPQEEKPAEEPAAQPEAAPQEEAAVQEQPAEPQPEPEAEAPAPADEPLAEEQAPAEEKPARTGKPRRRA